MSKNISLLTFSVWSISGHLVIYVTSVFVVWIVLVMLKLYSTEAFCRVCFSVLLTVSCTFAHMFASVVGSC